MVYKVYLGPYYDSICLHILRLHCPKLLYKITKVPTNIFLLNVEHTKFSLYIYLPIVAPGFYGIAKGTQSNAKNSSEI